MQLAKQMELRENPKLYNYLKENSYYLKNFNRDNMEVKNFAQEMKIKYKERVTDKLNNAAKNMELISSVLNVFK